MRWIRRRLAVAAAAVVLALALAAGLVVTLSSGHPPAVRPDSSVRLLSPFTGEPVTALRRVLAVKIDNIAQARPQTGLTRADIVYVLPVEGGLSRLLAVFSSDAPPLVGPVRSAQGNRPDPAGPVRPPRVRLLRRAVSAAPGGSPGPDR